MSLSEWLTLLLILLLEARIYLTCQPIFPYGNPHCTNCGYSEIRLTGGRHGHYSSRPSSSQSADANVCNLLSLTCTPSNGGTVFMQFNGDEGGPAPPSQTDISVVLNCVSNHWVYHPGDGLPSRVINEVTCINAF